MPTSSRMHRTDNHAPVGGGVPDDPPAALPKNVIANRRTPVWQSVPLFALSPKNKTPNYAKHKNPKTPCE